MSTSVQDNRIATLELMTTVQIIAMVLAIFGAGGFLAYHNSRLIGRMEKRFEQMEKRFDDLKQVVLGDRQRREGK